MLKKIIIRQTPLFLLLFIFCTSINARINGDSLRVIWENTNEKDSVRFKAINTYYKNFTYAQPDSVLVLIDYHFNLAKARNSNYEMSYALNEKSYAYYLKGDTNKSRKALKKAIDYLEQITPPPAGLASVYSNMGNIYGEENNYQEAIRYFYKTLKVFRETKVRVGEARILHNIGLIYYKIDNYDLALDHFWQSINIYKQLGREKKTGTTLLDIGVVFYEQKKYEEAIEKGNEALKILIEINNKYSEADCYFLLAKSHRALKQGELAKYYVDKSLEIDQTIKNNSRIIERLTFVADLTFDSNLSLATKKAEDVLKLIQPNTENELKANLYNLLYKCYKAQGNNSLSLEMLEKYSIHNDSVQIEKNNSKIIREAIKSEFETKLQENQLANNKTQAALKSNHQRRTLFIIFISIFLIASILFYTRKTILDNRKQRDALLEEIEQLKKTGNSSIALQPQKFELNREKIEKSIDRKINETDWNILNILLDDPVIPNKEIAAKAFMSVDGIGSALRRMYDYFEIKPSKYKKISLLMEAIKMSNI